MEELGNILPAVFRKPVSAGRAPVLSVIAPLWPRMVGKIIARQAQPVAFCEGVLTLVAFSECWTLQLRQMSDEVTGRINAFLGAPLVQRLRVRRETAGSNDVGCAQRGAQPIQHGSKVHEILWPQSGAALDPELTSIVERSFVKYFSRNRGD